jgi:hypothetical protein
MRTMKCERVIGFGGRCTADGTKVVIRLAPLTQAPGRNDEGRVAYYCAAHAPLYLDTARKDGHAVMMINA